MSDCNNEMSSQFKAIQARLDRIDDDLIANYAGVSQLVAGLAANPLTAGSVAPSLKSYNFSAVGQTLVKKLMGMVPGYNQFKALQNLEATALVGGLAGKMTGFAQNMLSEIENQIAAAVIEQIDAVANVANAVAAQAGAIARHVDELAHLDVAKEAVRAAEAAGLPIGEINRLKAEQATAEASVAQAAQELDAANLAKAAADTAKIGADLAVETANKTKEATGGFIKNLTNIAGCKTPTGIIGQKT